MTLREDGELREMGHQGGVLEGQPLLGIGRWMEGGSCQSKVDRGPDVSQSMAARVSVPVGWRGGWGECMEPCLGHQTSGYAGCGDSTSAPVPPAPFCRMSP